jgi:hypothetical protein
MPDPELLKAISVSQMADTLRGAGYRAQLARDGSGRQVIQSAAQGLGFIVCPGNSAQGVEGQFVDFSFNCLLRAEGSLQVSSIEAWNAKKRFSRLYREGELLILAMDVLVAGGISQEALLAHCELWDRLLHDLIAHLKTARAVIAAEPAPAQTAGKQG